MAFPYQCLVARSESSGDGVAWTLFGTSGSKIVVQSSSGAASVWSQQAAQVIVSDMHWGHGWMLSVRDVKNVALKRC